MIERNISQNATLETVISENAELKKCLQERIDDIVELSNRFLTQEKKLKSEISALKKQVNKKPKPAPKKTFLQKLYGAIASLSNRR